MSHFQVTAPSLSQVILSNLGTSIRPAALEPQSGSLNEPGLLKGVGWGLLQQKQHKPWFGSSFYCPFFPCCIRSALIWCE